MTFEPSGTMNSDFNYPTAERFSTMSLTSPGRQKTIPNYGTRKTPLQMMGPRAGRDCKLYLFDGQHSIGAPSVSNKMWRDSISRSRKIRMRQPVSGRNDASGRFEAFLDSQFSSFSAVAAIHKASLFAEEPVGIGIPHDSPARCPPAQRNKTSSSSTLGTLLKRPRRPKPLLKPPGAHWALISKAPQPLGLPRVERWSDYTSNYDGTYEDPDLEEDRPMGFGQIDTYRATKGPERVDFNRKNTPPWLKQDSPKGRRRLLISDEWSISNPNRYAEPVKMVTTPIRVEDHPRFLGLDPYLWSDETSDDVPSRRSSAEMTKDAWEEDDDDEDDDEDSVVESEMEHRESSMNAHLLKDARKLRKQAGQCNDDEGKSHLYNESKRLYTAVLSDSSDARVGHFTEALYGLGVIFRKLNLLEKAIEAFQHYLMLDPSGRGGSVHNNLGQALSLIGRYDEAHVAHGQALHVTRLREQEAKTQDAEVHPSFVATLQSTGIIEVRDRSSLR